ncbi:MAG: hypothetical protein ACRDHF_02585 [Tepidiformaceae bacterium]
MHRREREAAEPDHLASLVVIHDGTEGVARERRGDFAIVSFVERRDGR